MIFLIVGIAAILICTPEIITNHAAHWVQKELMVE